MGPATFVVAMGVEQALRPGFNILSNTISELGVDIHGWSYAWMFTAAIIILGLLTLFAAYGLIRVLSRAGRIGAILLGFSALGCVGVGIFNEDAYLVEHSISALDQFVTSGLALLFLAPILARDPRLGPSYATLSRLCGIIVLVSLVFFVVGAGGQGYNGLVERVIVGSALLWAVIIGLRLWHLPRLEAPAVVPSHQD